MVEKLKFQLGDETARRYDDYSVPIMAPFVAALVERTEVCSGSEVLDLACGTGYMAEAAAMRTGPSGRVAGADVNAGMLAVAADRRSPLIEWYQAPADRLPFTDAEFDVVLCQQGMQFFPDLTDALVEAARV